MSSTVALDDPERLENPSGSGRPAPSPEPYAAAFAWGAWALLVVFGVWFVRKYAPQLPYEEDWYYIDFLIGKHTLDLSYLWEQMPKGDHRLPLFKILIYFTYKWFGVDVRPMLYLNFLLFAGLAAGMIWAAGRLRGRASYADAFFPILLLNPGQAETFLWAQSALYTMATALAGAILAVMVVARGRPGPFGAAVAGVCLVLLPLTFGGGVAMIPFLALWMGITGYRLLRSSEGGRRLAGRICLASVLIAGLLVAAYLFRYHQTVLDENDYEVNVKTGPVAVLKTTLKYVAMALGPAVRRPIWPASGLIIPGILAVEALCVLAAMLRGPSARRDVLFGLCCFLGACLLVAAAVGKSRVSWSADALFQARYAGAAAPILLVIYFLWESSGPASARLPGRILLLTLVSSTFLLNWFHGVRYVAPRTEGSPRFLRDVKAGAPISRLVASYAYMTYHLHDVLTSYLEALRDARIGDFARLPIGPKYREISLPFEPSEFRNVEWDGPGGRVIGELPAVRFYLPRRTFVAGLRIKFSSKNPQGLPPIFWVDMGCGDGKETAGVLNYIHRDLPGDGREVEVPIWLCRTLRWISVHPDKRPCDFTLPTITLLVPESDADRMLMDAERDYDPGN